MCPFLISHSGFPIVSIRIVCVFVCSFISPSIFIFKISFLWAAINWVFLACLVQQSLYEWGISSIYTYIQYNYWTVWGLKSTILLFQFHLFLFTFLFLLKNSSKKKNYSCHILIYWWFFSYIFFSFSIPELPIDWKKNSFCISAEISHLLLYYVLLFLWIHENIYKSSFKVLT